MLELKSKEHKHGNFGYNKAWILIKRSLNQIITLEVDIINSNIKEKLFILSIGKEKLCVQVGLEDHKLRNQSYYIAMGLEIFHY